MPPYDDENGDNQAGRRDLIDAEPALIASLTQPESKDYDAKYNHLLRDLRMSWLNTGDENYLNIALPLLRVSEEIFGNRNNFANNIKHDIFAVENLSVGRDGKALKTLITRKIVNRQVAREVGQFSKKRNDITEED